MGYVVAALAGAFVGSVGTLVAAVLIHDRARVRADDIVVPLHFDSQLGVEALEREERWGAPRGRPSVN